MADAKKVLIVEDEKPMARALQLKLEHEGYGVTTVHNGRDAIELLGKETFDIILCDLVMPNGDGFEVLETRKEKKMKTPIVVLSNLSQEDDKTKAKALGAKDFFVKADTSLAEIVKFVKSTLG